MHTGILGVDKLWWFCLLKRLRAKNETPCSSTPEQGLFVLRSIHTMALSLPCEHYTLARPPFKYMDGLHRNLHP
jgi:hypothetical protein